MKINSLELQNFRNFPSFQTKFSPLNLFLGKNGSGKTNLLESINFLSIFRTPRAKTLFQMINFGKDFLKISATVSNLKYNDINLFFYLDQIQKVIKLNSVPKQLSEALGIFKTVSFYPEDLDLLSGPPPQRRRFLNLTLSQLDSRFVLELLEYQKVIFQRNRLLQNLRAFGGQENELDYWDQKLAQIGFQIIEKRERSIEFFNQNFNQNYQEISKDRQPIIISYQKSVEKDNFLEQISAFRDLEIQRGQSLYGPHRDDFVLQREGQNFAYFSSRGEQRSAILALKICQVQYLQEKSGERPVLLLDDIFSELDKDRRESLTKLVFKQQTILTSAEKEHVPKEILKRAKIVELDK